MYYKSHQYADDLMLYTALVPSMFSDLMSVADCTDAVSTWFMENALLLNPGKTEAVIFGTRQLLASLDITGGINVAGSTVQFNDALKLLGVTLDASLSFDKHVTNVVRACTFHTRALRHIRPLLTLEAAKAVAVSIMGAHSTTATVCSMARLSGTSIVFSGCKTLWRALSSELHGQPVHLISYVNYTGCL